MVQFLLNYVQDTKLLSFSLSLIFLIYNTYYKSYCYYKSKEQNILSSMIWLNLFSFFWPLLTQYNNLTNITQQALLLNIFRGFNSFLNFYLYWALAYRYLPLKFIIFGECLNESILILRQCLIQDLNYLELLSRLPYLFYTLVLCLKHLKSEANFENSKELLKNIFLSIILITLPRLISTIGDHVYFIYKGSGNANLDTLYSSLTILVFVFLTILWRIYYHHDVFDFRIKLSDIMSLIIRADMRIASYFLNAQIGPLYVIFLDKLGFWLFKLYINVILNHMNFILFLKGFDNNYLLSSIFILLILLITTIINTDNSDIQQQAIKPKRNTLHQQTFWQLIPLIIVILILNMQVMSIYSIGKSLVNFTFAKLFTGGF